jgi:hypothetical protein
MMSDIYDDHPAGEHMRQGYSEGGLLDELRQAERIADTDGSNDFPFSWDDHEVLLHIANEDEGFYRQVRDFADAPSLFSQFTRSRVLKDMVMRQWPTMNVDWGAVDWECMLEFFEEDDG